MGKNNKLIILILCALIFLETAFIVILAKQKAAETKEKLNLRLQLKTTSEELSSKEARSKELEKQLQDLEKVRADLKTQIDQLTASQKVMAAQMEATKQATEKFTEQFKRQQEDTFKQFKSFTSESRKTQMTLIAKIESLLEAKRGLEEQLSQLKEGGATGQEPDAETSSAQAQPQIGPKPANAAGAKQGIALGRINVQRRTAQETQPSLLGSILSVDNNYNFAVIDLGRESGLKVKDKLFILRQEKKIGEAEVKEIYRNMSLIDIIPDKTTARLRKNDKIIPAVTTE